VEAASTAIRRWVDSSAANLGGIPDEKMRAQFLVDLRCRLTEVTPLGLFLRTSILFIWRILSVFLPP
jgi:hypothetical protein